MEYLWYAILAIGYIGSLVTGIWFLIVAFRQGVGWGLLCFVPFGSLVVLIKFWQDEQKPFLYGLVATGVVIIGTFGLISTMSSRASDFAVNLEPSDYSWEPEPVPAGGESVLSDEFTADEAGRAVDALFEGTQDMLPSPTPEPLPEGIDDLDALPQPLRRRGLTSQPPGALGGLIGRQVMLVMKSGQQIPVFVEEVSGQQATVRRKVGGGSIAFTVELDQVDEVLIR
jgi:hypothetical protein